MRDFCGKSAILENPYTARACPPVIGRRKRNNASMRSVGVGPLKLSNSVAGMRSSSTSGMKAARALLQKGVAVNACATNAASVAACDGRWLWRHSGAATGRR
jgi:hypothetical protein